MRTRSRAASSAFLACVILSSAPGDAPAARAAAVLQGTVVEVIDGDSVLVRLESGPIEVRTYGADTPEYDQPGGFEATRALRKRLPRGTVVTLEPKGQDRYDRMVAVLDAEGSSINRWLVREGHAWAYRNYATEPAYCRLEDEARIARRGLWSQPRSQWIAPWEWRHRQRDSAFQPTDRSRESLGSCLAAMRQSAKGRSL